MEEGERERREGEGGSERVDKREREEREVEPCHNSNPYFNLMPYL